MDDLFAAFDEVSTPARPRKRARPSLPVGEEHDEESKECNSADAEIGRLRSENERLQQELSRLQRGVIALPPSVVQRPLVQVNYQYISRAQRKHIDSMLQRVGADANAPAPAPGAGTNAEPRGLVQYFETFCIDRFGHREFPTNIANPAEVEAWDIPLYEAPVNAVPLPIPLLPNGKNDLSSLGSCFNCGGSHSIRNCPIPKDENAVRENSKLFRDHLKGAETKTRYHSRYHQDGRLLAQGSSGSASSAPNTAVPPPTASLGGAVVALARSVKSNDAEDGEVRDEPAGPGKSAAVEPSVIQLLPHPAAPQMPGHGFPPHAVAMPPPPHLNIPGLSQPYQPPYYPQHVPYWPQHHPSPYPPAYFPQAQPHTYGHGYGQGY